MIQEFLATKDMENEHDKMVCIESFPLPPIFPLWLFDQNEVMNQNLAGLKHPPPQFKHFIIHSDSSKRVIHSLI